MPKVVSSSAGSRAFDFRIAIALPGAMMMALLLIDPSPLDFFVSGMFYLPESGFFARQSFLLESVLHNGLKKILIALVIGIGIATLFSFLPTRIRPRLYSWRREFGYALLAITLSTAVVAVLKVVTDVHCPWNLTQFGGSETYSRLFAPRPPTNSSGRCWPSGHASTGFSLFALFFALRDRKPAWSRIGLGAALLLGTVFSLGRIAQGAHFLSHNIWTMLFDWLICLLCYRWLLYRPRPSPA